VIKEHAKVHNDDLLLVGNKGPICFHDVLSK
jgi:hypothetical protein